MKNLCTLRVNREGSFIVFPNDDAPSRCGKKGTRGYKYFVSIEATNKRLTAEGYVIENGLTDKYFRDTYHEKYMECPSCEQMAQDAIDFFRSQFKGRKAPELTRIYVRINGTPFSFIEATWLKKGV